MWEDSGWITKIDPYGWFMWYCRFYLGRRSSDDDRQIGRGNGVFGPSGRWRKNLINKVVASGKKSEVGCEDAAISPVIRQLLQVRNICIF
jgi:1-acyl-sn-glycerol-3-phosphate acyltransferase